MHLNCDLLCYATPCTHVYDMVALNGMCEAYDMLWYAVLRYASMLCYVMFRDAMICYAVELCWMCYAMVCYARKCYSVMIR